MPTFKTYPKATYSGPGTMLTQVWNDGARTSSNLWFFSFKSWWLAGAGLVARGRHLMVPELSSGAPGAPQKNDAKQKRCFDAF